MFKKTVIFSLVSVLVINSANAGINGALDSMFLSNSTAPTAINTADRNGFMMGGASIHVPVTQINLISFDPPRFNMGCGGIDLYLGSFSFINSQALVAMFKQIVANAAAALFMEAIKSISEQLASVMAEFQKVVGDLNNMFRNTCQAGMTGTEAANQYAKSFSTLTQDTSSLIDSAKSMIPDFGSGQNAAPSQVVSQNTQSNQPAGTSNPALASAPSNDNLGNFVWKMFSVSQPEQYMIATIGVTSQSANAVLERELLMSFSGTAINAPGNVATSTTDTTNPSSAPSGSVGGGGATSSPAPYAASLHLVDILNGSGSSAPTSPSTGTSSSPILNLIACNDDAGGTVMPDSTTGCQVLDLTRPWNFEGTKSLVKKLMYGTPAGGVSVDPMGLTVPSGQASTDYTVYNNGIIYLLSHCPSAGLTSIGVNPQVTCGMSPTQIAFLNRIDAPIQSAIIHMQSLGQGDGGNSNATLFSGIIDVVARQYEVAIGRAILAAIQNGLSGSAKQAANEPKNVSQAVNDLNSAIIAEDGVISRGTEALDKMNKSLQKMLENNPNAIDAGIH